MKAKLVRIYVVVSLVAIAGLSYSFFYNLSFKQKIRREERDRETVDYFNDICLGGEEDGGARLVRKWRSEMRLYIVKDSAYIRQVAAVKEVVKNANKLFSDGFKISITTDSAKANTYLILAGLKNTAIFPRFNNQLGGLTENFYGHFTYNYTNFVITSAVIYINTGKPWPMQQNAITEEVIQALGMANDAEYYKNSIFYQHKYDQKVFTPKWSAMDEKLIRILYDPKMLPGLNRLQTTVVAKEVLAAMR